MTGQHHDDDHDDDRHYENGGPQDLFLMEPVLHS